MGVRSFDHEIHSLPPSLVHFGIKIEEGIGTEELEYEEKIILAMVWISIKACINVMISTLIEVHI